MSMIISIMLMIISMMMIMATILMMKMVAIMMMVIAMTKNKKLLRRLGHGKDFNCYGQV